MRVLVTGGRGQLARAIQQAWKAHDLILLGSDELDLASGDSIRAALAHHRPTLVLNAGAFTQVDLCESEPDSASAINARGVGLLAEACETLGACLIQISTDYVFDGTAVRPYREDDPTHPISVYGRTKLQGEQEAARCRRHLIVRTSWLYESWGRNFFNTMLNAAAQGRALRVVDDQRGAPTTCRALARQLEVAADQGWEGLVHATCAGETSWHGFAAEIFARTAVKADLRPCRTEDYPTAARRPAYSVLDGSRRRAWGPDVMPDWRDALAELVERGFAG